MSLNKSTQLKNKRHNMPSSSPLPSLRSSPSVPNNLIEKSNPILSPKPHLLIPDNTLSKQKTSTKRKAQAYSDENVETTSKKPRFKKGSSNTVISGDVDNIPLDITFSFSHNGSFRKTTSTPFKSTQSLAKNRRLKGNHELTTFELVDDDGDTWKFTHPDEQMPQWENEEWVEGVNNWFNTIIARCLGDREDPPEDSRANRQWSTTEWGTLRALIITFMRRKGKVIQDCDWAVIAAKFNLAFKGTTRPQGVTLMSSRGQQMHLTRPFALTKNELVLGERSGKSLCTIVNRREGKKMSVWVTEYLREAEELGWLKEDETVDGLKCVFKTTRIDENGEEVIRYEDKNEEEVAVTEDEEGDLVAGGKKVLVLEDEEDESDDEEEDEDILAKAGILKRRQLLIEEEVSCLLADPIQLAKIEAQSAITVRAEYEKVRTKETERVKRKAGVAEEDESPVSSPFSLAE